MPIGNRRAGHAGRKELAMGQGKRRHETAVAVSAHADALGIDERVPGQPGDGRFNILQFLNAELAVRGPC